MSKKERKPLTIVERLNVENRSLEWAGNGFILCIIICILCAIFIPIEVILGMIVHPLSDLVVCFCFTVTLAIMAFCLLISAECSFRLSEIFQKIALNDLIKKAAIIYEQQKANEERAVGDENA